LNARQKRLFEEARRRNPELKIPSETQPTEWSEADLALIKQGVGDKSSRPQAAGETGASPSSEAPSGEQGGAVVTYFEAKGFGFLRPDDGGRDIFFHVSRLTEGLATDLRPGTRVLYELGMDRTGKMAASSVRIAPPE
jgi:CspA family cold shock protein